MPDDALSVWMQGRFAGRLSRRGAEVTFDYDPDYVDGDGPALSVSLPKRTAMHDPAVVAAWFDNLLPDNDDVRVKWATAFGERRPSVFGLLTHMGADCAGAVQVLPVGERPDTSEGERAIDPAGIERRLRELRRDPSDWNIEDTGGRWSLGGAQGKFALSRSADGSWSVPTGRAASTHIFKIGPAAGSHGAITEHLTGRMASLLGIQTAHTELRRFGTELAVISERFDRVADSSGHVLRIHQEDLCQAMGVSRALKYQADGGPSVAEIGALLGKVVDPRDRVRSRDLFAQALAFNWIVAGTDAHAKNYSVIHVGASVRLAPLYDLASAAMSFDPDKLHFHGKLAMKMGGEYRLRSIELRHLQRTAGDIGVDPDWFIDVARGYARRIFDVLGDAIAETEGLVADAEPTLRSRMERRLDVVRQTLAE